MVDHLLYIFLVSSYLDLPAASRYRVFVLWPTLGHLTSDSTSSGERPVMENTSSALVILFPPMVLKYSTGVLKYDRRLSSTLKSASLRAGFSAAPAKARNMEILTNAMPLEQSNCLDPGPMIRCYSFLAMETCTHPTTIQGFGRQGS